MTPAERPLFLFDGHCRLCSSGVATLMRLDRRGVIDFASAQSALGRELFANHGRDPDLTYLLIVGDEAYGESDGYLRMCALLGGPWRLFGAVRIVPRGLRDRLYRLVAQSFSLVRTN